MKAHIVVDKRKYIEDNKDAIKECLNTTLDEEYEYLESLKADENADENKKMFETLVKDHEALRRAIIDGEELSDLQVQEVGLVLRHRAAVMKVRLAQLQQASEIVSALAKNFE